MVFQTISGYNFAIFVITSFIISDNFVTILFTNKTLEKIIKKKLCTEQA